MRAGGEVEKRPFQGGVIILKGFSRDNEQGY